MLVVEDEALTALSLQQVLEDAGFDVLGPVADALDGMGVPFVLCTGYHSPGAVGERHARAPVLVKPVGGGELVAAVGTCSLRESP